MNLLSCGVLRTGSRSSEHNAVSEESGTGIPLVKRSGVELITGGEHRKRSITFHEMGSRAITISSGGIISDVDDQPLCAASLLNIMLSIRSLHRAKLR